MKYIAVGELPADPTETKSAHCKVYVEPSVKAAIEHFQIVNNVSFSEAAREIILSGFKFQTLMHDGALKSIGLTPGKPFSPKGE